MKIVNDSTVAPSEIADHWQGPETFALVSGRASDNGWVRVAMEALPAAYRKNHFCILTSGSTGKPKLIVGQKARAERLAGVLHRLQNCDPVAETIVLLPLSYSYAFVNQWVWSYTTGRRLVATGGLSCPEEVLRAFQRADNAMVCLVGSQAGLISNLFGGQSFGGIIRVHFAGGRFPQERYSQLRAMFPNADIYNNYGCAEAMPRLTLRLADADSEAADIGTPLPGVAMTADPGGQLLFRSEYRGVAQVDGAGFHAIADDLWLPTGDLGMPIGGGRWRLLGRSAEVFKRHGEKVSIPQVLGDLSAYCGATLTSYRELDSAGEDGYVLVSSPELTGGDMPRILSALRQRYGRAHWPLRIESIAGIPLLPNGKIDTSTLKDIPDKIVQWRQRI